MDKQATKPNSWSIGLEDVSAFFHALHEIKGKTSHCVHLRTTLSEMAKKGYRTETATPSQMGKICKMFEIMQRSPFRYDIEIDGKEVEVAVYVCVRTTVEERDGEGDAQVSLIVEDINCAEQAAEYIKYQCTQHSHS